MKIKNLYIGLFLFMFLPAFMTAQKENVDLSMVYKIKMEGQRGSQIDDMAFRLCDSVGSRLTGSTGNESGNKWAKKKMEDIGLQNVRIESDREFTRGGWDNLKTYAAMTAPYYTNFACNPVAWTGSTEGLVKSEVVLMDVRTESDLDKYKGKIA